MGNMPKNKRNQTKGLVRAYRVEEDSPVPLFVVSFESDTITEAHLHILDLKRSDYWIDLFMSIGEEGTKIPWKVYSKKFIKACKDTAIRSTEDFEEFKERLIQIRLHKLGAFSTISIGMDNPKEFLINTEVVMDILKTISDGTPLAYLSSFEDNAKRALEKGAEDGTDYIIPVSTRQDCSNFRKEYRKLTGSDLGVNPPEIIYNGKVVDREPTPLDIRKAMSTMETPDKPPAPRYLPENSPYAWFEYDSGKKMEVRVAMKGGYLLIEGENYGEALYIVPEEYVNTSVLKIADIPKGRIKRLYHTDSLQTRVKEFLEGKLTVPEKNGIKENPKEKPKEKKPKKEKREKKPEQPKIHKEVTPMVDTAVKTEPKKIPKPNIVNLTGHAVRIIDFRNNFVKTYHSNGDEECRLETVYDDGNETIDGVSIPKLEVTNLPGEKEGTYYIVSGYIKAALPARKDLLQPDSTKIIRDNNGSYIGVRGFIR